MAGFVLHLGATVLCGHGGQAVPLTPNPRVLVSAQPTVLVNTPHAVAGCPFPPVSGGPCVSGQWLVGSTRVLSNGQPLALMPGVGLCVPTAAPLLAVSAQTRVIAL